MKRLILLSVLALTLALSWANAQAPASLEITPQAGAWFVCATSFTGDDSGQKAYELAQELRQRHRLNAYVFDRGADERRKLEEEIRRYRQLVPGGRVRRIRIEDQHAVLVGGYKDMETARRALDDIKELVPADKFCIRGDRVVPGKSDRGEEGVFIQVVKYSPFLNAFVVHNPTIPVERPKESAQDLETVMREVNVPLLKKLNANEPHSLLRNPKAWTLVVATFQSPYENVTSPVSNPLTRGFNRLLGKEDDKRSASAENAQKFAATLRELRGPAPAHQPLNLDTYVLHTSYYSLVTVGNYDNDNDPRLRQVQQMFQRMMVERGPFKFLAQPMPMPVPR